MPWMYAETLNYQQTAGYQFQSLTSGYLGVQNSSTSIYKPFLWWEPSSSSQSPGFFWWENDPYFSSEPENLEELENLDFVKFELSDDPSEFTFLVIPNLEENPFKTKNGDWVLSESYDPSVDISLFDVLLKSDYERCGVDYQDLTVSDLSSDGGSSMVNHSIQTCMNDIADPDPTDVPESSSILSFCLLGLVLFLVTWKRKVA
ncbi:hypothetical protein PN462_16665 [Spirulina sp. CS-785/01]|uniref:hypothetical protein n=1 Tax=Spirulina sp. CS-785/01 TaxID=3021716 RepID=UPI00232D283C|nr:hypothetical protein [Spirulina sp. CS-785/01]MDB9314748.1 hypothetical protein [Spirulina sp. CS-785/01]